MNLLALDTSTPRAALALGRSDGATFAAAPDPSRRHGRGLLADLRDLLAEAGLGLADLGAIAVGLGPGSYTGLRVGVTAAKTLAYAAGRRLVGFDSLEAVARNAPADALRVAVVADAQRGDLFAADFARDAPGAPLLRLGPTGVESIPHWLARLAPGTFLLGPGLDRLPDDLPVPARIADPASNWPDGPRLLDLARDALALGQAADPWFLEPVYLRRSAAEEQWEALGRE